jgi:DNA-binding CsgD family transcriptional regulator
VFSEDDAHLLHTLAPILGTLIRRGLLRGARAADPEPREPAPATLILDTDLQPASWTSSIAEWFAELRMLPPAVYELGARVRTPPGEGTGLPASVRMRTAQGRWVTMEGAPLEGVDRGSVAITIRASTADEIFDLLAKTYDLTRRERELAGLLLDGFATKQLADALCISSHTVQDHLKAVFAKAGVRSRRELVSNLAGRAA